MKFAAGLFSVVLANSNIFTPAIGFSPDDSTGAKVAGVVAALMVAFFTPGRQISPQLAGYSRSVTYLLLVRLWRNVMIVPVTELVRLLAFKQV